LVSLAQQLSLAAQAANKIEDFKQPSLVKNQSTYLFFVLRIQTEASKGQKKYAFSVSSLLGTFLRELLSMRSKG